MGRTPSSSSPWDTLVSLRVCDESVESKLTYALACFLGALQLAAARADKKELAENAKVTANVFLGHPTDPNLDGFGLRAEINVDGCPDDAIIAEAHEVCPPFNVEYATYDADYPVITAQFCPYSRALKHGAEVTVTKT